MADKAVVTTCQRVYLFEGHTNYLCGLPSGHDGPCGDEFDKRVPGAEAELRAEVTISLVALTAEERAVVEALVAERSARDAIPKFEGMFPSQEFWDGNFKAEAAMTVTERALDALLASRAKCGG